MFSDYFLMIDEIINCEHFFSKEQINDIKNIKVENENINKIAKITLNLLNEKVEKKVLSTGEIKPLYVEKLRQLAVTGNLFKQMQSFNKLEIPMGKFLSLYNDLDDLFSLDKINELKKVNRGLAQMVNWIIFVFEFNKIVNPFDFVSSDYLTNRFEKADLDIITYYIEVIKYLKTNLKVKFKFSKNYGLKEYYEKLKLFLIEQKINPEQLFSTNSDYAKITELHFQTKDKIPIGAKPAYYDRIILESLKAEIKIQQKVDNINLNQTITLEKKKNEEGDLDTIKEENSVHLNMNLNKNSVYDKEKNNNKIQIMSHFNKPNNVKVGFNDIPNDILIKNTLFYLDVQQCLPKFSLVNKKALECTKTHMIVRVFFLNKEKQAIEKENEKNILEIEEKRKQFYEEYEILPPSKENALEKIRTLTYNDITEIKQCFRKYNEKYEQVIAPLVVLLGNKPQIKINLDGTRRVNYFESAQKLLINNDVYKKIVNFEFETIPQSKFSQIEKILDSDNFKFSLIKKLSNRFHILLVWYTGLVEFHRAVRFFSLNSYDYEILTNEELNFCQRMDYIYVLYYKLLRYVNCHCKAYEKKAQEVLSSILV